MDGFIIGGICIMWLCAIAIAVHALHIKSDIESMKEEFHILNNKLDRLSSDIGHIEWVVQGIEACLDRQEKENSNKPAPEPEKETESVSDDIHLITHNEFEFEFDQCFVCKRHLCFYPASNKLFWCNEELKNVCEVIGPALGYIGYNRDNEKTIYVRNHRYHSDFAIHIEEGDGPMPYRDEPVFDEVYSIVHNKDHYDVIINGEFYCSADTIPEASKDIEEYFKNKKGEVNNESEGSKSAGEVAEERSEEEAVI